MNLTLVMLLVFIIGALAGAALLIGIVSFFTCRDVKKDKSLYDFADYVSKEKDTEE